MITQLRSRTFGGVPAVFALELFLAGCSDPNINLVPTPAPTPGVSIGPFTSGSASTTATITVQSVNSFSGFVNLSATCCYNVLQDQSYSASPGYVTWNFSTNPVNVPSKGSASSAINIFMPALTSGPYPNIGPNIPFGKHLISVVGKSQSGNASSSANVGVTVLPSSEPTPGCRSGAEPIALAGGFTTSGSGAATGILQTQITAAEASPRTTTVNYAIYRATGPEAGGREAFKLTITDGAGLSPILARVVLVHKSPKDEDKEISTHGCSSLGKNIVATKGQTSVQMLLNQMQDRTMYLREKSICNDLLCTSKSWADAIVFPEPAFWSVFGGKNVRIEWHECLPVLLWCL